MQEPWVRSLGWEDPLEKEMAIHSSTIAWKIPWTEEPGRLQSMGSQRVRHDWATSLSLSLYVIWIPSQFKNKWKIKIKPKKEISIEAENSEEVLHNSYTACFLVLLFLIKPEKKQSHIDERNTKMKCSLIPSFSKMNGERNSLSHSSLHCNRSK